MGIEAFQATKDGRADAICDFMTIYELIVYILNMRDTQRAAMA
jgi:hypothetical protein